MEANMMRSESRRMMRVNNVDLQRATYASSVGWSFIQFEPRDDWTEIDLSYGG
jgi:hypothetical protein